MLNETEKQSLVPIFDQILITTEYYNGLFPGFEVYITGSSLNLVERAYNDIDLMVVIPEEELKTAKKEKITHLWELFKNKDHKGLSEQLKDTKIKSWV